MTCSEPRIPISGTLNAAGSIDVYADFDPRIRAARGAVAAAARPTGALDPLLSELVRLRNAELQGCNF